jgi:hypothetical protein
MDMPMDVFRALIADTISTMSVEELRNIILQTPDKELGAVGAAVLAEKRKMSMINVPVEGTGNVELAVLGEKGTEGSQVVPPTTKANAGKRKAVGRAVGNQVESSKRKRELR